MSYQPSPVKRESVITKAADELCRFIALRRLAPGDPLPPETRLSAMLGISRNSLREALRILDGLGFVGKRPGRRAIVRSRSAILARRPPGKAHLMEGLPVAYEARMLVEQRCAELAAQRASGRALAELDRRLSRFEAALKRRDFVSASRGHAEFHDALVHAAGNPVLAMMFEGIHFVITDLGKRTHETLKNRQIPALHRAICRALHDRDPARAAAAVRRHFHANRPLVQFMSVDRGPRSGS